jgi:hypothetical protein
MKRLEKEWKAVGEMVRGLENKFQWRDGEIHLENTDSR